MLSPYECVVHVALIKIEEIVLPNHRNEKAISNLETSTYIIMLNTRGGC